MSDKCSVLRNLVTDFNELKKAEKKWMDGYREDGNLEDYNLALGWVEALGYAEVRLKETKKRERCK